MGARSGSNYLSALKKLKAEVWLGGDRIAEVTSHPAFRDCARSLASLCDLQMERVEQMTYRTDDGGRSGLSFIQPKSIDELRKRSRMMAAWANFSGGIMLQTPDLVNVALAAMASARDFFAASDPRFGDNIANYYLEARKHDWCATLVSLGPESTFEENAEGIVVNGVGSSAPLAPYAEELLVLPSASNAALAFAIPCNSMGVRLECLSVHPAHSRVEAPLSSRFAQGECIVVLDNALVPWERMFLFGDFARCSALLEGTGATAHMMHQQVVKSLAQAEFLLGLAAGLAETTGEAHRELLAEIIGGAEAMRTCLRTAESDAAPNEWAIVTPVRAPLEKARNLFARLYPRVVEIIQLIGGAHVTAPSSQADPYAALHRLAWDATGSTFARRQLSQSASSTIHSIEISSPSPDAIDLKPLIARVKDFLNRTD